MCWPVLGLSKDKDENLMMIQLRGSAQFNEVDACLMSVVSRVIAGSLYKLRAERNAVEQLERSKYIIETFRALLPERNIAIMQQKI